MTPVPPPNETIAELVSILGEADAKEIVRSFLSEFPTTIRRLTKADRVTAHRLAHSLKSSARHVGAMSLSRRMATLEAKLEKTDSVISGDDLANTLTEFESSASPLRRYLNS